MYKCNKLCIVHINMYILVSSYIPITIHHSPQGFLIIINTKRKETMIKCPVNHSIIFWKILSFNLPTILKRNQVYYFS